MSEKEKLPWGLSQIAPGSIKSVSKDVLEAFDTGTLNMNKKHLSKKEQEELRKKQEEEAAAFILKDFEASFDDSKKNMPKMFVKGSVFNPLTKEENSALDKGVLYEPALKLMNKLNQSAEKIKNEISDAAVVAALNDQEKEKVARKKTEESKKKSNLELFKEELKRIQLDRDERHKKKLLQKDQEDFDAQNTTGIDKSDMDISDDTEKISEPTHNNFNRNPLSVDDTNTTNIFISNLSPKTQEKDLVERFGKFGLLASVKIMWPRTEEDKIRNANCGFVAFMTRRDAEEALKNLEAMMINGHTMRLSWSKSIVIPTAPIFIPPELTDILIPPPPSGLPFNAQPMDSRKLREFKRKYHLDGRRRRRHSRSSSRSSTSSSDDSSSDSSDNSSREPSSKNLNPKKILKRAVVKVVVPTDRTLLCLIHRVIEYVINEGPAFEAMLMTREMTNPLYRFLFDHQSPAHSYYRWRMYSILNGDSAFKWKTKPFRMFKGGSYWLPPPVTKYTQTISDDAYDKAFGELEVQKGAFTKEKRDKMNEIFKNLNTERKSISEAMIFCIDNAEKSADILQSIVDTVSNQETALNKKIAFLYLITDILHNCIVKVANASSYRKGFETTLPEIFDSLHTTWLQIDGRMKSESFKQKVLNCIRAWEDRLIYPNDYLVNLQNKFLGLVKTKSELSNSLLLSTSKFDEDSNDTMVGKRDQSSNSDGDDVDGKPLEEDDDNDSEDIDGEPIESKPSSKSNAAKFVSSKWETVDPEKLEKQAITTSKWDDFFDEDGKTKEKTSEFKGLTAYQSDSISEASSDDIDGKPLDEEISEKKNETLNTSGNKNENSLNPAAIPTIATKINIPAKDTTIDETRRKMLRDIEVKVLKYIDELETGKSNRKTNKTIQQQGEDYRAELLKKAEADAVKRQISSTSKTSSTSKKPESRKKSRSRSRTRSPGRSSKSGKKRSRSNSPRSTSKSSSYVRSSQASSSGGSGYSRSNKKHK